MAVGVGVAVLLAGAWIWLQVGWVDSSDGEPGPTSGASGSPSSELPLGVELAADDEVILHVPDCPGVLVTEVRWAGAPDFGTELWAIRLDDDAPARTPTSFALGATPDGYRTETELATEPADVPGDRDTVFVTLREGRDGSHRRGAAGAAHLADLRVGMIRFDPEGAAPARMVASVEEYEAAVGCD